MGANIFGTSLRKARELNGYTQRQLAQRLGSGVAASTLSRWESGKARPRQDRVKQLSDLLGGNGALLREWRLEVAGAEIPSFMRSLGDLENEALTIDTVTVSVVPGLVQCLSYAREVFRAGRPTESDDEIERLSQLRVSRHEALVGRNNPLITAVFPQFALEWMPEAVRKEQAESLLHMVARGRTSVQVFPNGSLYLASVAPVQVYRLRDGTVIASSDHGGGNFVHQEPSETAVLERKVRDALSMALPVSHTVEFLRGML
ncbi:MULTISPECIES: helix-turn-helix domain-containing protein [Nocardiopsidaceae]|uniref:Helix-turn-helix transcriptional regulator n=1 Tax=Streptomonospora nanhaiensis TaxID=1323731 RepID=A0ABY6YWN8_9ACTN|nr:helix-turn-helix transcriptional regulator [Streptomonospora nanhaiensis]WAE76672.1 helix-turn-helix transcriptional regulator [Streptomonospora nanhaiensis]